MDILFSQGEEPGHLREVMTLFLSNGFLPSAKHQFQLLRELLVDGKAFIFNVDFLHPGESEAEPNLFVDHLELPIPASEYRDDSFTLKSIMLPEAAFLFEGHIEEITREFVLPLGEKAIVRVSIMGEVGTVVTKSQTVGSSKRTRDAFDVFLAVEQARDYGNLVDLLLKLKEDDHPVYNTLYGVLDALDKGVFARNTARYLPAPQGGGLEGMAKTEEQNTYIAERMRRFLTDVKLGPKAANIESRRYERRRRRQ